MPWANDGGHYWNAFKCTPVDPNPNGLYEPCTVEGSNVSGVDDCEIHMMCWNVDPETNVGTCYGMCTGSAEDPGCEDPYAQCILYSDGVVILCYPNCDPLTQDCPGNDLCIGDPSGNGFVCVPDASGEAGAYGDPCEYLNVCDPGLFCAAVEIVPGCVSSVGCCTEFCDLTHPLGNGQCAGEAGGAECVPWYEIGTAPARYEHVGACVIPA